MSCPPQSELMALESGKVSLDERLRLEAHLASCEDCRRRQSPSGPSTDDATASLPVSGRVEVSGPQAMVERIGPYVLLDKLGKGGMGTVYAAYHSELDRQVAVKLLHHEVHGAEDSAARARLLREAQALARLSHPNVVGVYDAGTWQGRVYLVMEHVPGGTLRDWQDEAPRGWKEVRDAFLQAGKGLAAAHAAGLVHRDFKPANVLVGKDGRVRVADFGLARATAAEPDTEEVSPLSGSTRLHSTVTQAGTVVGTLAYMAPEQLEGRPADARSDQFSFCVALWDALYGQRPFAQRPSPGQRWVPRAPPEERANTVPSFLRAAMDRGLSEAPEQRFPSMEALLEALALDPSARRRRWWARAGLGALAVAAVATVAVVVTRERDATARLCQRPAPAFAGVWDEPARAALHQAFLATGLSYAEETAGKVEAALDAYTAKWSGLDHQLCEATLIHHTQSEETRRRQSVCLEGRRNEVEAMTRLLAKADATMVGKAIGAVGGLSAPDACADLARLALEPPGAEDVRNAAQVAEWRKAIQSANAQSRLGKYEEGIAAVLPLIAQAEAAHERAVVAQGLAVHSFCLGRMGQEKEGLTVIERAFGAAVAGRDDVVAFHAVLHFVTVVAQLGQTEEARRWLEVAESFAARLGASKEFEAELLTAAFFEAQGRGDMTTALARAEAAAAAAKLAFPAESPRLHPMVANLASAYGDAGHYEEAIRQNRELSELFAKVYGANSPHVAIILGNLGADLEAQGHPKEALRVGARALDIIQKAFGSSHRVSLSTGINMSTSERKLGLLDTAWPRITQTVKEARAAVGSGTMVEEALMEQGFVAFARGDVKAARGAFLEAKALGFARDPKAPEDAVVADGLGQVDLAEGKAAAALPRLERALSAREKGGSEPSDVAVTRFALARALAQSGGSKAQARELATKAEQELAGGEGRQRELAEVRAWLNR